MLLLNGLGLGLGLNISVLFLSLIINAYIPTSSHTVIFSGLSMVAIMWPTCSLYHNARLPAKTIFLWRRWIYQDRHRPPTRSAALLQDRGPWT